jgi:hypothetical protein
VSAIELLYATTSYKTAFARNSGPRIRVQAGIAGTRDAAVLRNRGYEPPFRGGATESVGRWLSYGRVPPNVAHTTGTRRLND